MRVASVSVAVFGVFLVAGIAPSPTLAVTCPNPGERPATAEDLPLMKAAGFPDDYLVIGSCWKPTDPNIGQAAGQAKEYLRSILCKVDGDNYGGAGADGTIQGLDAKFAQCATNFIKSASQNGIPVCVKEGYRTPEKQNEYYQRYISGKGGIACGKKGVQRCEHPSGIAIDINTNSEANYAKLHRAAPSFGLTFYLGFKDKVHFVPKKGGCSAGGNVPPDQDIPPNYYDFPDEYPHAAPSGGLSDALRKFFGGQNQQQQQQPPPPPPPPPQQSTGGANSPSGAGTSGGGSQPQGETGSPTPCTPSYSCKDGTYYYNSSSCQAIALQKCANGCSGNTCAPAQPSPARASSPSSTPETNPVSESIRSANNPSAADIIGLYAEPVSGSVDVGSPDGDASSTPIALNPEIGEFASGIASGMAETGEIGRPAGNEGDDGDTEEPKSADVQVLTKAQARAQGNAAQQQPPAGGQTFTSSDLSQSAPNPAPQNSALFNLLDNMKQVVSRALYYLKPFGGAPARVYAE
ncbi:MAG: D-alanyl-D-alanine carboxypeptidase family protein [Patescibacteria group bacterium]|nr:D-alanyl-D-alanine carboxypeptidase family protein [Patescibacteria group bacterium]